METLAARVIIYEGDCPVLTPGGAILYRVRTGSGQGTGPKRTFTLQFRRGQSLGKT